MSPKCNKVAAKKELKSFTKTRYDDTFLKNFFTFSLFFLSLASHLRSYFFLLQSNEGKVKCFDLEFYCGQRISLLCRQSVVLGLENNPNDLL